jgi:radical SAM-linked protein
MPIIRQNADAKTISPPPVQVLTSTASPKENSGHFKYLVHYSRTGSISQLGHLEMMQSIFRALRRACMPTNFTQGFNPLPKISFGPALAAGTESDAEFFIMDLSSPLTDCSAAVQSLNKVMVPGLEIREITPHSGKMPQLFITTYILTLPRQLTEVDKENMASFMASHAYVVPKTRKGVQKDVDIRPMIARLSPTSDLAIELELLSVSAQPGIKPIEALQQILRLDAATVQATTILKSAWRSGDSQ